MNLQQRVCGGGRQFQRLPPIVQLTKCIAVADVMIPDASLSSDSAVEGIRSRTPVSESGTAEDIATTALPLTSDASAFISGQAIMVNVGLTA